MRLHHGVHAELEAAANALIAESLKGVTKPSEKSDILTAWKEQDRRKREIFVSSGTPEVSNRSGIYHRAINRQYPHLNSATEGSRQQHLNGIRNGHVYQTTWVPSSSTSSGGWDSE